MRIEFAKDETERSVLGEFTESLPERLIDKIRIDLGNYDEPDKHKWVDTPPELHVYLRYLFPELRGKMVADIEEGLHKLRLSTKRTSADSLWITGANAFLYLECGWGEYDYFSSRNRPEARPSIRGGRLEEIGKKEIERDELIRVGWFRTKSVKKMVTVPVYKEIPAHVRIRGKIFYEAIDASPEEVLDVLKKLRYDSVVIPTPEEVKDVMERYSSARNNWFMQHLIQGTGPFTLPNPDDDCFLF